MEVEYEAQVSEKAKELASRSAIAATAIRQLLETVESAAQQLVLSLKDLETYLQALQEMLAEPIRGTVEVDEEDVRGEPYPDWQDMD